MQRQAHTSTVPASPVDFVFLTASAHSSRNRAVVRQRLECCDGDPAAVDFEEMAQLLTRVGAAVTGRPEYDIAARDERPDLAAYRRIVGGGDDRTLRICEDVSTYERRGVAVGFSRFQRCAA